MRRSLSSTSRASKPVVESKGQVCEQDARLPQRSWKLTTLLLPFKRVGLLRSSKIVLGIHSVSRLSPTTKRARPEQVKAIYSRTVASIDDQNFSRSTATSTPFVTGAQRSRNRCRPPDPCCIALVSEALGASGVEPAHWPRSRQLRHDLSLLHAHPSPLHTTPSSTPTSTSTSTQLQHISLTSAAASPQQPHHHGDH